MAAILATGANAASLEERVAALEETNKTLTEEVLATQTGGFTLVEPGQSYNGLGDAASKVYYSKNPLSIGGYGEMYYAKPENGDDYADVYRFITYFGYKFSDNVILNAEIEFEHGANAEDGGEVVLEFMYLDFLMKEEINLRAGHVLVPMGLVNLRHEPTLFNAVQRPEVEQKLLPSTWHENGALSGLTTTMFDVHARYENGPFKASGLYTQTTLDGAEKISSEAVEKGSGFYVNAAYDIGSLVGIDYKLPVFAQYENYNPVESTVDGLNEDKYKTEKTTIGLNFFPADQAVIKIDYAFKEVNNVDDNIFSLGLGFIF